MERATRGRRARRLLTRDEMRQVQGVLSTINPCLTFCARCLLHAMTTSGTIKPGARVLFPHIHFSASFMAAIERVNQRHEMNTDASLLFLESVTTMRACRE